MRKKIFLKILIKLLGFTWFNPAYTMPVYDESLFIVI